MENSFWKVFFQDFRLYKVSVYEEDHTENYDPGGTPVYIILRVTSFSINGQKNSTITIKI